MLSTITANRPSTAGGFNTGVNRGVSNILSRFGSNKYVSGARSFLASNSIIAKFSFFIVVLILFLYGFKLGVKLLQWFFADPNNPVLISGIKDGRTLKVIRQDPDSQTNKLVKRSVDEKNGIEFTWSTWLYVKDLGKVQNQYQHIFHKGTSNIATNDGNNSEYAGMNYPINGPGLYLDKLGAGGNSGGVANNLVIAMNTTPSSKLDSSVLETVRVRNIPIKKWIHVVIRVQGRNMDVYINGTVVLRHVFRGVPKQNYGNVYSGLNGGFDGMISDLRYFNSGLSIQEIMRLNTTGPNMKQSDITNIFPPYFSLRWYFQK